MALGHPLGCTGARITITLINELRRREGGLGAAALCGSGERAGPGTALLVGRVRRIGPAGRLYGRGRWPERLS